jgi:para-nitrobenzyl esterase
MLSKRGAVFKGIRYARSPLGDLRWREPAPLKPWKGVHMATIFGAICPQNSPIIPNAAGLSNEECLFLNVWTAEWPSKSSDPTYGVMGKNANLPVMGSYQ